MTTSRAGGRASSAWPSSWPAAIPCSGHGPRTAPAGSAVAGGLVIVEDAERPVSDALAARARSGGRARPGRRCRRAGHRAFAGRRAAGPRGSGQPAGARRSATVSSWPTSASRSARPPRRCAPARWPASAVAISRSTSTASTRPATRSVWPRWLSARPVCATPRSCGRPARRPVRAQSGGGARARREPLHGYPVRHGDWDAAWSTNVPLLLDAATADVDERRAFWALGARRAKSRPRVGEPTRANLGAPAPRGYRLTRRRCFRAARPRRSWRWQPIGRSAWTTCRPARVPRTPRASTPRAAHHAPRQWADLVLPPTSSAANCASWPPAPAIVSWVLDDWGIGGRAVAGAGMTALFAGARAPARRCPPKSSPASWVSTST